MGEVVDLFPEQEEAPMIRACSACGSVGFVLIQGGEIECGQCEAPITDLQWSPRLDDESS